MKRLNYILAIFCCAYLTACEEDMFDIESFGSISGVVVDGETYEPLVGVMVSTAPSSTTILTDSAGAFTFEKVRQGDVIITARKNEYLTSTANLAVFENNQTVTNFFLIKDERNIGNVLLFDPVPGNGAVNQQPNLTFQWNIEQQNRNVQLSYTVYIFESNSSTQTLLGENLSERQVVVSNLRPNTTYYWYVVARADGRNVANSPTWSFRTQ
ncbi:carboxypeptidase-like regulatory domain-containing protein [Belliella sp. DSM 111904]|uniref:Carboxypeptidase-like regulatory domain-containing protein n=1 Tax=Belliella filtrata TaxID=2923435 RepID=A0ABS9V1R6_9BACT|nr:carboxypeptidase-like regulatory domain-containing protein [Belliella filtrata]MCH7410358.1 carboxypeptidase-like regulatory domain-containing protein [Belliella filtrata]